MKKTEPKLILNLNLTDTEFEEKMRIVLDDYLEKIFNNEIESSIQKIVEKRVKQSFELKKNWNGEYYLQNSTIECIIKNNVDKIIGEFVEKHIKQILEKKLQTLL